MPDVALRTDCCVAAPSVVVEASAVSAAVSTAVVVSVVEACWAPSARADTLGADESRATSALSSLLALSALPTLSVHSGINRVGRAMDAASKHDIAAFPTLFMENRGLEGRFLSFI